MQLFCFSRNKADFSSCLPDTETVIPWLCSQKPGKWCAMHVHIAWQTYHHQQKVKVRTQPLKVIRADADLREAALHVPRSVPLPAADAGGPSQARLWLESRVSGSTSGSQPLWCYPPFQRPGTAFHPLLCYRCVCVEPKSTNNVPISLHTQWLISEYWKLAFPLLNPQHLKLFIRSD